MTQAEGPSEPIDSPAPARIRREVIRRHSLPVRLTHWVNALAIFVMIGSGLAIFDAHPRLYWGARGDQYDPAVAAVGAVAAPGGGLRGVTRIGAVRLSTTGVLGVSESAGAAAARAFPAWITIPSRQNLAAGRRWHFFFAWVLVANGAAWLVWSLASRHLGRDLWPTWNDLRAIPSSVLDHLRLRHPTGEAAKRYNVLQRLAYLGLVLLVLLMIATGLTMSPAVDAAWPFLLDLFGGRQSARALHFIFASLIALFILVHLVEVALAGPLNEVGSMITGRWRVPPEHR